MTLWALQLDVNLFVLRGILPTKFSYKQALLALVRRAQGPNHILNDRLLPLPL